MNQSPHSLRVQIVLYENNLDELQRGFESLVGSLRHAAPQLSKWSVAYGDCSPTPVLNAEMVATFDAIAQGSGGSFSYEFFQENLGHGGGHNRLHVDAVEELLLIVNPDGILAPDTVSRLLSALTPGVGIVDARQIPMEHPKSYDSTTGVASWSSLACGLTPASVFRAVGGIDHETFPMYCDDVDYSWRVRLQGLTAKYCPEARMFHDKRLDPLGHFIAGETERYSSAQAALLLAYKYSRSDIVANITRAFESSSDPYTAQALQDFTKRLNEHQLPAQLDADHRVADFTEGHYGSHRF